MAPAEPCQLLEWDSEFFGRRIARVRAPRLGAAELAGVLDWTRRNAVDCLYYLAGCEDAESIRCAEDAGFRLTDLRVTLTRPVEASGDSFSGEMPDRIRRFAPGDLPRLRAIARVSHRDSRFYRDPHFEESRCGELYERWIENCCRNAPEAVFVALEEGAVAGYLGARLDPDAGQIELVAVDPAARGRSLGKALTAAALRCFAEAGRKRAVVVTQGGNVHGLRLYRSLGFGAEALQLWYHLWPADLGGRAR